MTSNENYIILHTIAFSSNSTNPLFPLLFAISRAVSPFYKQ